MERKSNYEVLCDMWQEKFRRMDQALLRRRLPELQTQGVFLTLRHFGRLYGVHRETGEIAALEDTRSVTCDQKLNIYTLLGYCQEGAGHSGRWVPFRDVPGAGPFGPAFQKNILEPLAATFAGHTQALQDAAPRLGGLSLKQSDAGCLLYAFDCIPMEFLFWDGDEEFPAQANILFDDRVTEWIHVESTVTLASEGLLRLAEAAGLPVQGRTFHT